MYIPIQIDIRPGVAPNAINIGSLGVIPVAILRTADFNPATVSPTSLCFGDAEAPAQRDCTLAKAVALKDVDRDRDIDMLLHFDTQQVGIDLGDTTACMIGLTTGGVGIYGCDSVKVLP